MVVRIHQNANGGVRSPGIVTCMKAADEIEGLVSGNGFFASTSPANNVNWQ